MEAIAFIVLVLLFAATSFAWWMAWRSLIAGRPLVPAEPRVPPRWGLVQLIATVFLAEGIGGAALAIASNGEPNFIYRIDGLFVFGAARLVACGLAVLVVRATCNPDALAQGLFFGKWRYDFALALGGFALLTFPVITLRLLLSLLFSREDVVTDHPLLQAILEDQGWKLFFVSVFVAVVVAPIIEEFFFRLLLQGWFERLHDFFTRGARRGDRDWWMVLGQPKALPSGEYAGLSREPNDAAAWNGPATEAGDSSLGAEPSRPSIADHSDVADYYRPPRADLTRAPDEAPAANETLPANETPTIFTAAPRPWWPTVLSSLLFSLAHFGHGLDPIPLFFLSLGLGIIFRQTGRLLPCVLLHMFFNGFSMLMMGLHLLTKVPA